MTAKVLFVDDEPKILDGLRRTLRDARRIWDMTFAEGGALALEIMDRAPVDVVVSDMRMPDMDGGQLLTEIQRRHPRTIRFVLSGQCEEEVIFGLVGNSHQFLSKPCDPDRLIASIQRALSLRDLVAKKDIQCLVSNLCTVPSPSNVHTELVAELSSDSPSLDRIAKTISRDTAFAAKILQLSNCAYFGTGNSVSTPFHAVKILGLETINALVLTHGIVTQIHDNAPYDRVWRHGLIAAGVARAIAEAEGQDDTAIDNAGVSGLLHDIGALLLAAYHPQQYKQVIARTAQESDARMEAERQVFGVTHSEVGAYLVGLWGLPDSVVEAVAHHHDPRMGTQASFDVLTTVHVAEGLTQVSQYGENIETAVDHDYLAGIGLVDRLPAWQALTDNLLKKTGGP